MAAETEFAPSAAGIAILVCPQITSIPSRGAMSEFFLESSGFGLVIPDSVATEAGIGLKVRRVQGVEEGRVAGRGSVANESEFSLSC